MRNVLNCSLSIQNNIAILGIFFFFPGSLRSNKNSHCDQLVGGRWSSWTWWRAFTGGPLGLCQWEIFGQRNFGRGSGSIEICTPRKSFSWNLQTFGGKDCIFFFCLILWHVDQLAVFWGRNPYACGKLLICRVHTSDMCWVAGKWAALRPKGLMRKLVFSNSVWKTIQMESEGQTWVWTGLRRRCNVVQAIWQIN